MGLLDLSLVTKTFVQLLELHIDSSPVWPDGKLFDVTPRPPDELTGDATLGLYLYHVEESPAFRNAPNSDNSTLPVRFSPMGLDLHYQLTAHSDSVDEVGPYVEQLMIGCALKAVHDFPVVDDRTEIGGSIVMPPALRGSDNRLRISFAQTPVSEAVNHWTTTTDGARLSAYYTVGIALLEGEEAEVPSPRALSHEAPPFVGGYPHISGNSNRIEFDMPDGTATDLPSTPARVAPKSDFTLEATSLEGDTVALMLRYRGWAELHPADNWALTPTATATSWTVTTAETANGRDIIPGIYSILARVTTERVMPDGSARAFTHDSNESPFAITPRIDPISPAGDDGTFEVTGYLFRHDDLSPGDLRVYAGDSRIVARASEPLDPGEFVILDSERISVRLPTGAPPTAPVPIRIFVNGVESPPRWVVAP